MAKKPQVKVNCAHDEMVPLHKLTPNSRNPNTHPDEQVRLLAKIIDYTGWRHPITVSNQSGFIVRGHARLLAAQVLGVEAAPVDFQDYDNEAQEWADLIADNRIAELAEIDRPALKDILQELDTGALDMEITGFSDRALEDLMTAVPPRPDQQGIIDEFTPPETGKSKGDQNWFYVEYYGKPDSFAEIKATLEAMNVLVGDHQMDGERFAVLVMAVSSAEDVRGGKREATKVREGASS